jgi:hypothetical protein
VGRPLEGYRNKAQARVPGTTSVAGLIKEAGGLIHWAWQQGQAGLDYRATRDAAATAGTLAHAAVERWVRGEAPVPMAGEPAIVAKAERAYGAFLEWAEQTRLRVTEPELSLVSEEHQFGGTLDALFLSGRRAVGDWKTADQVYPEALLQLAAYGRLWDETYPADPITGGYHLLRFDKTFGDFHHHYWPELEDAWVAFLHCRALYDLRGQLKLRCR